jgi:AcrR family transcriptional regulator
MNYNYDMVLEIDGGHERKRMARASVTRSAGKSATWYTPAAQERSRLTLEAIFRSALHLLNEKPFDEITVSEICRSAGCSPPSFYQRFRDKEALLHAIHEKYTADSIALIRQFMQPDTWGGEPVEKLVHALVQTLLAMESRSGGLRVTAVRRSFSDERFAERIRTIRTELYAHLAALLRRLQEQIDAPNPERAARFLVRLIQGAGMRHFEGPHLEDDPPQHDELVDELCRVSLAYLGVESERSSL